MKKIIVSLLIIFILSFGNVFASEIDLEGYVDELKNYSTDIFEELDDKDFASNLLSRKYKY